MTSRQVLAPTPRTSTLTDAEEAAMRAAILASLHTFAQQTGAPAGDDVVRWFDSRLRCAQERTEAA